MLIAITAAVSLVLGFALGLLSKPSRAQFSVCHGTTLSCSTCGKSQEVSHGSPRTVQ